MNVFAYAAPTAASSSTATNLYTVPAGQTLYVATISLDTANDTAATTPLINGYVAWVNVTSASGTATTGTRLVTAYFSPVAGGMVQKVLTTTDDSPIVISGGNFVNVTLNGAPGTTFTAVARLIGTLK